MIIELLGSLLFLGGLLAIAVSITAVDEHRQRKRARESERRAIQKIKEDRRKAAWAYTQKKPPKKSQPSQTAQNKRSI